MTLWQAAPRTSAARAALAAAEADRRARPERYTLDPERIAEAAARHPGDERSFSAGWHDGLTQYLGSAREDGRLHAFGLRTATTTAIGRLRAGAAMARWREARPVGPEPPLIPPIVVTGGWRTGTTFLFRLLATDPRLRAPLPLELINPCRASTLTTEERAARLSASEAGHDRLRALNPELWAIHDSGGRLPEECCLGMGSDLRNWAFPSTMRLDSYASWLALQDMGESYLHHRSLLQVLDRGDGRRWVIKAPTHTAELPHLVAALPGAVVVQMHRDVVETIASGASLFAVFRSTYSDHVDAADVGRFQADQTELWLRRAQAFRRDPTSEGATFLDLDYLDLVRDPAGAAAQVYEAADMDPPEDLGAFVAAYHRAHPRHAHGTHRYDASAFGLDAGGLRERFAFLDAPL